MRKENDMDVRNKKVLIFGAGKSGVAAAELLRRKGALLLIFDGNGKLSAEEVRRRSDAFGEAEILLGTLPKEKTEDLALAVLSPGVSPELPEVQMLREAHISVIGEIELAFLCGAGRIAAITGTNGKTTTTSLTGELLATQFRDVRVVGNIGIPYTQEASTMTEETVTVAEISSYQLETTDQFHPEVSAILNFTPDHLDRHHTMENYIAAKERITERQTAADTVVLNYEDPVLREFGKTLKPRVIWFSSDRKLNDGLFFQNNMIYTADQGTAEPLIEVSSLQILGKHNYENAMAAAAIALAMGVPREKIVKALMAFRAVEHRIEFVTEIDGVRYYNDSKGTNPDAAIKAVEAMDRPTVLIGGGYDKGATYEEWIATFPGKVKKLLLLGQTADKIASACETCGFTDYEKVETLADAVSRAAENAKPGDAVLLSPACASWGMFVNYEERGKQFKELVNNLSKSDG